MSWYDLPSCLSHLFPPLPVPPPHLHHLLTPSDLVHLPSTTSTPTPRCTHATMLHIEPDLSRMRRQLSSHFYSGKVPLCIYFDLYIITLLLRHSAGTHSP